MPTWSADIPISKVLGYIHVLSCGMQKRKYKTMGEKQKKYGSTGDWTRDLLHASLLPYPLGYGVTDIKGS